MMNFVQLTDWFLHPSYADDLSNLRKARVLVRASLLTSLFSTSYVILSLLFNYEKGVYFTAFNVVGYFILPFLARTKISLSILTNIFPVMGAVTVCVLAWFSGGMWSAIYPWVIAVPVLALLIAGRSVAIIWTLLSLGFMILIGVMELNGYSFPVEYDTSMRTLWFLHILPGLLLIIMVVSFTFEFTLQSAIHDVESHRHTIEKQSLELRKVLNDKDDIIRILAHDLRNPLSNITVLTKLLEMEEIKGKAQELVSMINTVSNNANILVKNVLEMATLEHRQGTIELLPIELGSVIKEVVQSFKNSADKKEIVINYDATVSLGYVKANLIYLRSALENLLSNALKFSPSSTEINISVDLNESVQIRVRDHGPGIIKEEEEKLFKKFARLSAQPTDNEESSGLGLSLVKRYMELMNGRVWFERPPDRGAIFVIELLKA